MSKAVYEMIVPLNMYSIPLKGHEMRVKVNAMLKPYNLSIYDFYRSKYALKLDFVNTEFKKDFEIVEWDDVLKPNHYTGMFVDVEAHGIVG